MFSFSLYIASPCCFSSSLLSASLSPFPLHLLLLSPFSLSFLFLLLRRFLLFISCLSSYFFFFSISSSFLPFAGSLIFSLPLPSLLFCFFRFFSSIGRFFLSFFFFFSLLPWLFLLFSVTSFFLFIFVFVFCFLFLHLPFTCDVIEVCSFFFFLLLLLPAPLPPVFLCEFFSLHLPLYSSAVLLFRWRFAFCSCLGGNPAYRVASLVGFAFVCHFLLLCSSFVYYEPEGGGETLLAVCPIPSSRGSTLFRCPLCVFFFFFLLPVAFMSSFSVLFLLHCAVVLVAVVHCRSACPLSLSLSLSHFLFLFERF